MSVSAVHKETQMVRTTECYNNILGSNGDRRVHKQSSAAVVQPDSSHVRVNNKRTNE
jgi:hypothetical protein